MRTDAPSHTLEGIYRRLAAIAFPMTLLALGFLGYRDVTSKSDAPPPAANVTAVTRTAEAPVASVFGSIYRDAGWGRNEAGEASSGLGSTLESTVLYRTYLQAFLKEHHIRTVVDAGCGDWEFSHAIDWSGIDYKGYDVVPEVIAKVSAKYTAPNVHFFVANVLDADLPPADLLLTKHVLQHLTNADVGKFIGQFPKYVHILLTDGVDRVTLSSDNPDILRGQYRPLDPTRPPFGLHGEKTLTWWDGYDMHQVVHLRGRR